MILTREYAEFIASKLELKVRQYYDKKFIFSVKSEEEYSKLEKELELYSINPKSIHVELLEDSLQLSEHTLDHT